MATEPFCPHCSAPMVDAGDIPTFVTEEITTGLEGRDNAPLSFGQYIASNVTSFSEYYHPLPLE